MTRVLTNAEADDLAGEFVRSKCLALAKERGWNVTDIKVDLASQSINIIGKEITQEEAMAFFDDLRETCKGVIA